jgi:glycerol-3-phosphate cytidylyltransferase
MRSAKDKIIPWSEVAEKAAGLKGTLVSTNGCFDILHWGHLSYLEKAKNLGDVLWVAVNSDGSVRKLKGPTRPIQNENFRALQLGALEAVDYVTVFDQDTPVDFLKLLRPHIHTKGGDYSEADLPETPLVKSWDGRVVCLPLVAGLSTSLILSKI